MKGITFLDIAILILFLYFVLGGYNKGFIKQTSTLVGLVAALLIAINYYRDFQSYLIPYFDLSAGMMQFISFAVLFILVNLFIHLLGLVLKNLLNLLFLEPLDHIAGAALGLVKGVIIAYFLVLLLDQIPYSRANNLLDNSYLANSLLNVTPIIQKNLQDIFRP
ncbi:MAG: rane protein required for colicin production [Halanaerobiales bacterium]|nr:rane protein required for colicin production [Halanaerobiales bacterium]